LILKVAADTPHQHVFTYPSPVNTSFTKGLVLGGISWQAQTIIDYTATITGGGSSASETIEFQIKDNFKVYFTSFHLLLVDPGSPYVWMTSGGTALLMQTTRCLRST
jgi:hypothetical protein